ncbi:MAG: STAS domain-containing protein [Xanthomonadales bacterium]|nr:STAS domain-containing protein [Xanthomonadales bacterium]
MTENSQVELEDGHARLRGELTFATTPGLYSRMQQALDEKSALSTIDLAKVTTVDSSGLALLLEWQAAQHSTDSEFRIDNAPDNLLRLARLCEAEALLNISGRRSEQ